MENITVGQLAIILASLVAFLKGIEYLIGLVSKKATEWLKKGMEPINNKLDDIDKKIDKVDKNATMNYLVRCMDDMEKGNSLDSAGKKRFYEQMEHYSNDLHGNSYIHDEFQKLKQQNKI